MSYIALFSPEAAESLVFLPRNAYSLFAGHHSAQRAWTDYHLFMPMQPKAVIGTRSGLLSSGNREHDRKVIVTIDEQVHVAYSLSKFLPRGPTLPTAMGPR